MTVELPTRNTLRGARRVLIKAGTSVVANKDGRPSLTRLGAIVEQLSELNRAGIEVIFVSSGAVGMGKQLLRKQSRKNMSFMDLHNEQEGIPVADKGKDGIGARIKSFSSFVNKDVVPHTLGDKKKVYDSACAAAGQVYA